MSLGASILVRNGLAFKERVSWSGSELDRLDQKRNMETCVQFGCAEDSHPLCMRIYMHAYVHILYAERGRERDRERESELQLQSLHSQVQACCPTRICHMGHAQQGVLMGNHAH